MRSVLVALVLLPLATGCGLARQAKLKDAQLQQEQERARILRMYRTCLERREVDPTVDCSSYVIPPAEPSPAAPAPAAKGESSYDAFMRDMREREHQRERRRDPALTECLYRLRC